MKQPLVLASFAGALALTSASAAHAYCRTTTVAPKVSSCPDTCVSDGLPLYWSISNPSYILNEKGFPGLDDADARAALERAFDHWNAVDCDGDSIGLNLTQLPGTTKLTVGPMQDEPNDNTIAYFTHEEWLDQGLNDSAYALTAIWFNEKNGEILGADMHFNGGMGQLAVCPANGCPVGEVDLENVATHESGHFIGLAHSNVAGSTMWCSADPNEVDKRSLAEDDVMGACAIYPPGQSFPNGTKDYTPTKHSKICSIDHAPSSPTWLPVLGLGVLFAARRRRKP